MFSILLYIRCMQSDFLMSVIYQHNQSIDIYFQVVLQVILHYKLFLLNWENYSGESIIFKSTAYLAAARWFEAHLIPWTLDDLKPFGQQMCSILYQHNLLYSCV